MSVTANISVSFGVSETTTANTAGSVSEAYTALVSQSLAGGASNNQVNVQWSATGTLNGSTTLNLQSLVGTSTKSFSTIRGFYLQNLDATHTIAVAPAGSDGFTGPFTASEVVQPGGVYVSYAPLAGWSVTSTTNQITLTTAASVAYVLAIFGA